MWRGITMNKYGLTPMNFAIAVREHPGAELRLQLEERKKRLSALKQLCTAQNLSKILLFPQNRLI